MHLITIMAILKMKILRHHQEMIGLPIFNKQGNQKLKMLTRKKRPKIDSSFKVSIKDLTTMPNKQLNQVHKMQLKMIC